MDLTHDHLQAFADRIEASTRREVDRLRDDVKDDMRQLHGRVGELRDEKKAQNGRLEKVEQRVATLDRDLAGHTAAHDTFSILVSRLKEQQAQGQPPAAKPSKAFVAGVTAAAMALAGVAEGLHQTWEWLGRWVGRP